jgi:hypothetical protein
MKSVPCLRCATCLSFHSKHLIVSHGQPVQTRGAYERALKLAPWSG